MINTAPVVTHIQQPNTKLCWATCIKMALEVKGHRGYADITPQSIADAFLYDDGANTTLKDQIIKAALERYGINSLYSAAPLSWADVKVQINANRPVLVGVRWKGGGGHLMLIGGYEEEVKGNGPTFNWINLYDPLTAGANKLFFDKLTAGKYEPGGRVGEGNVWNGSFKLAWA